MLYFEAAEYGWGMQAEAGQPWVVYRNLLPAEQNPAQILDTRKYSGVIMHGLRF